MKFLTILFIAVPSTVAGFVTMRIGESLHANTILTVLAAVAAWYGTAHLIASSVERGARR